MTTLYKLGRQQMTVLKSSSLVRNAGWMLFGQGLNVLFQGAYFIVLARLLGPTQYGIYAGAIALVTILGNFSTLGSGTLFIRYVSVDRSLFSLYWGNILLTTALLSGIVVVALKFLAVHLIDANSASIILVVAIGECFCRQLAQACGQVFQTYERLKITALLNLFTSLMRLVGACVLLFTFHVATASLWATVSLAVSALVSVVAVVLVQNNFGPPAFSFGLIRQRALEGLGFSFSGSAASAFNDVDKTILSHRHMEVANGIYTIAYRAVDIGTMPIYSIYSAAFPRFFQRGHNLSETKHYAARLVTRSTVIAITLAAVMFACAPLIPHLVGRGYLESVSALRWLCLIPLFRSLHLSGGSALTGSGNQRFRTVNDVLAAAFNFGLNLFLIPRFGWLGAAWASLASDGALGALNWGTLTILSR